MRGVRGLGLFGHADQLTVIRQVQSALGDQDAVPRLDSDLPRDVVVRRVNVMSDIELSDMDAVNPNGHDLMLAARFDAGSQLLRYRFAVPTVENLTFCQCRF